MLFYVFVGYYIVGGSYEPLLGIDSILGYIDFKVWHFIVWVSITMYTLFKNKNNQINDVFYMQ